MTEKLTIHCYDLFIFVSFCFLTVQFYVIQELEKSDAQSEELRKKMRGKARGEAAMKSTRQAPKNPRKNNNKKANNAESVAEAVSSSMAAMEIGKCQTILCLLFVLVFV